MGINYSDHFKELINEVKELREQRDELNFKLFQVIRLVEITASMIPDQGSGFREAADVFISRLMKEAIGLTEAIRTVLRSSPGSMFMPVTIRKELERRRFPLGKYKSNPLASINSVLKRLCDDGEIKFLNLSNGKPAYQWKLLGGMALLDLMEKGKENAKE